MSEKKELNLKELESVVGGIQGGKTKKENVTFSVTMRIGYEVYVEGKSAYHQGLGRISEKGIAFHDNKYYPIYFIQMTQGSACDSWFYDDGGHVNINYQVDTREIVQSGIFTD